MMPKNETVWYKNLLTVFEDVDDSEIRDADVRGS